MKKKRLLALATAAALALALAGCSGGTSSSGFDSSSASSDGASISSNGTSGTSADTADDGDSTVIIGRAYDVAGLDPGFLKENAQVVDNIYDRLVMRDEEMNLVPGLATEWSQVNDTTWEFKLREGVKFHNGEDFNADAVKYSIDRVIDPEANSPTYSYIKTVESVEVIDEYTVYVHTTTADPLIPARFCRYPTEIVPPKYTEEVGQQGLSENPVGTGPYKFVSWTKDEQVVLEANEDYWDGAPEVKKVIFRSIPETSTRVSALITGEIDIAVGVTPDEVSRIESSDGIHLSTVEAGGNTVYVGLKCEEAPFDNKLVRQAMNYAIDVDAIVTNILGGAAKVTDNIIGEKDFGYSEPLDGYEYNPEKAKELLAEAGYPDGFSCTVDTVNWYLKCDDVAQAIAAYLGQVGITVTVNPVESSVYRTSVPSGEQSPMYFLGWSSTNTLDADAAIYSVLHSSDSYSTYNNPEIDAKLDEARSCMDETKRAELYSEIEKTVLEEAPRIFLYKENKYYGVSDGVKWEGRVDDAIPVATMSLS